jgi:GNAT superfamily N-acetyltransferase
VQSSGQSQLDEYSNGAIRIRRIDPRSEAEVELVASRMRQTLIEVEGEDIGNSLYTMDWLKDRVRWHLDAEKSTGQVFLAGNPEGYITGHTIVRIELDEKGRQYGLFSTTFVEPESRKQAIASCLLEHGEKWMIEHDLPEAATWTSESNTKLIELYAKQGYAIVERHAHVVTRTPMVKLAKALTA